MSAVAQLLRFTLPRTSACASAFHALRETVSSKTPVSSQYFGYIIPNQGFPASKADDDICWLIQWPQNSSIRASKEFRESLAGIAKGSVRSLLFDFRETHDGELVKGLTAPVCEFAIINLVAIAPRSNPALEHSMHKTFTDTYFAPGFTGGGWGYAINGNDANGEEISAVSNDEPTILDENERRLAYYCLGWETIELHHAYAKTKLFDEEIDKLKGWFGTGSGAFYVSFEKHA